MPSRTRSQSLLLGLLLCAGFVPAAGAFPAEDWFNGYAWSTFQPGGPSSEVDAVGISGNGSVLLAATDDGTVYISQDAGQTWNATQPAGGPSDGWNECAMSTDGSVILLGTMGVHVYLSTNTGVSWTQLAFANIAYRNWSVQVSPDGETLLVAGEGTRVHLSVDHGGHWNEIQPVGNFDHNWLDAALAGNGSVIMLVDYDSIYRSTDSGQQWTVLDPPDNTDDFQFVTMSANGQSVLVGDYDGNLFSSTDGGATWTLAKAPGDLGDDNFNAVAISVGGMRMAACTDQIAYTSSDAGATWYHRYLPDDSWTEDLQDLALSGDGSKIIVGREDGYVFVGVPNPLPTLDPTDAYTQDIITIAAICTVTDPGASAVTARGICWNTSGTPTVGDHYVAAETGLGRFTADFGDLTIGTTYYVRAYATNDQGTAYGREATVALHDSSYPFWTRVDPVGASASWLIGGISGNGKVMVIQDGTGGKAYISNDYGATWHTVDVTMVPAAFGEIAIFSQCTLSNDGAIILMPVVNTLFAPEGSPQVTGALGARLMLSRDGGTTWEQVSAITHGFPCDASISSDGQTIHVISLMDDAYYTSTDGGTTWTPASLDHDSMGLCAAADGLHVAAIGESNEPGYDSAVFISADGGQTWNERYQYHESLIGIDSSADGTHLYVVGIANVASHDGGATWSPLSVLPAASPAGVGTPNPQGVGIRVACSADGQTVLIGGIGSIYLSTDAGATWSPQLQSSDDFASGLAENALWDAVGVSADGRQFLAARYDGKLCIGGYPTLQTVTTSQATGVSETGATLGGVIDVQRFVPVSARGVCWNLTGTPTVADTHTTDGTGGGTFASTLTGLTAGTTYHMRAYAVSPLGMAYGDEQTFTTNGIAAAPDLVITIQPGGSGGGAGGQQYQVGQEAQFLITITNQGNGGATGVTVIIPIPDGTEFVSASLNDEPAGAAVPGEVTVADGHVTITCPTLAPSDHVSVTLVLRMLVTGQVSLAAQATSAEQQTPANADNLVVDVHQQDYYQIVTTVPTCGAFGVMPLLGTVFMLGFLRRRRRM